MPEIVKISDRITLEKWFDGTVTHRVFVIHVDDDQDQDDFVQGFLQRVGEKISRMNPRKQMNAHQISFSPIRKLP